VKNDQKFWFSLLLLQVFLFTSANTVFANTGTALDLDSKAGDFFKTEQNHHAVFFEENLSEVRLQNSSENDSETVTFTSTFPEATGNISTSSEKSSASEFRLNSRRLLKTQIFPFHFFW